MHLDYLENVFFVHTQVFPVFFQFSLLLATPVLTTDYVLITSVNYLMLTVDS